MVMLVRIKVKKYTKPNPESNQKDDVSSLYGKYEVPEASDNGDNNDSDQEDQDGATDDLEIGAHYKKPFFTNVERKLCLNNSSAVNDLQPNEDVLGHYRQPQSNSNKVGV